MDNWWGDHEVATNQTLRWQLGPKTLWITRGDSEWRVAGAGGQDRLDERLAIAELAEERFQLSACRIENPMGCFHTLILHLEKEVPR